MRGAALLLATVLLGAAGCGYSTRRLVAQPGVESVAVVQFDNRTYRRDLEFRLTQAVAAEVRARTPWRIASPSTADALLTGTIRSAETRVLAERDDDPVVERYRVFVDCRLVERATGRVLREWTSWATAQWTEGRAGETLEASATDEVVRSLAQRVVHGLERPVGSPEAVPPLLEPRRGPFPR